MTKAFLPQMKTTNHGHIVTVASALGLFSTACVEVRNKIRLTGPQSEQTSPTPINYSAHLNTSIYFLPIGLLCQ